MNYKVLSPAAFTEYQLLDCGNGEKLERFGQQILIRPEKQAIWSPQLTPEAWRQVAHARFVGAEELGKWEQVNGSQSTWRMQYRSSVLSLSFMLKLTGYKHIGLFPEQAAHWDYIFQSARAIKGAKVLNLFAYTGAASLAAKAGGADVIHLEGLKQIVAWAKNNMEMNKLENIRWLLEDAIKFVHRERKRGNKYNGIILDPPNYGMGPGGERFVLEDQIGELIEGVNSILDKSRFFVVCNSYSFKFSPLTLANLFGKGRSERADVEMGELATPFANGQYLSQGVFFRARSI